MIRLLMLQTIASAPGDFAWLHDDAVLAPAAGGRAIFVMALVGVGAALLAAIVVGRVRRDRARLGPVVRGVARDLGLSPPEQRLLARVAHATGRPNAGSLMVSRGCFDAAARAYAARYQAPDQLAAIRRSLFE